MVLVAMNSPLTLLKINRIRRQVPVHDRMAPIVEIESLLTGDVEAKTNGRNGELKADRTVSIRTSLFSRAPATLLQ
jgi:hypothetical protein